MKHVCTYEAPSAQQVCLWLPPTDTMQEVQEQIELFFLALNQRCGVCVIGAHTMNHMNPVVFIYSIGILILLTFLMFLSLVYLWLLDLR